MTHRMKVVIIALIAVMTSIVGIGVYAQSSGTAELLVPQLRLPSTGSQQVVGPAIASAATIAPTYAIHHVTGTTAVVNITVPYTGFSGQITLIPDGAFTWTAAGNIAVLGSAVVNKALVMTYDPVAAKWYPSYVS